MVDFAMGRMVARPLGPSFQTDDACLGDEIVERRPLRRLAAMFLDGLIVGIPFYVVIGIVLFSAFSGGQFRPESIVIVQLLSWSMIVVLLVYEGLMLAARGQTLGKMAVGIKVVRADGSDLTTGQAWGRAAMRQVLVSCLCIINYLPILFTQEKTALHDMVVNTRVVNWS